jgi:hypothetical protein
VTRPRIIIHPRVGETAGDLLADLAELSRGRVPRTSHGGFAVDDDLALAYLERAAAEPAPDVEAADDTDPSPEPDLAESSTTDPDGAPADDAERPARPRRVPPRKAVLKGAV